MYLCDCLRLDTPSRTLRSASRLVVLGLIFTVGSLACSDFAPLHGMSVPFHPENNNNNNSNNKNPPWNPSNSNSERFFKSPLWNSSNSNSKRFFKSPLWNPSNSKRIFKNPLWNPSNSNSKHFFKNPLWNPSNSNSKRFFKKHNSRILQIQIQNDSSFFQKEQTRHVLLPFCAAVFLHSKPCSLPVEFRFVNCV